MKRLMALWVLVAAGAYAQPRPDLVIRSAEFVDVTTGAPTRLGLFGGQGRMLITAANQGAVEARDFTLSIAISADAQLTFSQDPVVLDVPVTLIAAGATSTFDIPFAIPVAARGVPFATGNYYWFAVIDSLSQVTEVDEGNNRAHVVTPGMPTPVLMKEPGPDLTVARFEAPVTAGVGELVPVYRAFKNVGNRPATDVKYRYYLSANAAVTTADQPLKIVGPNGTMTDFGMLAFTAPPDALSMNEANEVVAIPATLTPGTWYLGAVIDTDGTVLEIDETNNGLASLPITVAGSALRITTSQLPDAMVGRPYSFQLAVTGEVPASPTTWTIDTTQGEPPEGLTLSTSGLLSGTPMTEAVMGLTVVATNAGRTAVARLALRVLPTTSQVEITTASLPSAVNNPTLPYETWLGAAGGVKPYAWRLVPMPGEALPNDLRLSVEGRLSGSLRPNTLERSYPVTFEVRDALGTTARRQLNLRVIAAGAIRFTNLSLPDGLVGEAYLSDIGVKALEGSPAIAKPVTYRVAAGRLPDGLNTTVEQDTLLLQGTPTAAGTFAFTLEVEDNRGRSDSADFLVRVHPRSLKVESVGLPGELRPGEPVDFSFTVSGASGATFRVFSGALPMGTSLSADGRVTGTIATENAEGAHNFVVAATDATGASGLGAFSVVVKRDPPRQGCSAAPASVLLLGALALAIRRRRQTF